MRSRLRAGGYLSVAPAGRASGPLKNERSSFWRSEGGGIGWTRSRPAYAMIACACAAETGVPLRICLYRKGQSLAPFWNRRARGADAFGRQGRNGSVLGVVALPNPTESRIGEGA